MFIVISRLRNKILAVFRFLLALAITAILMGQLFNLVMEAGGFFDRWYNHPSGNPMKVFNADQSYPAAQGAGDSDDGMIKWLKEYYNKE